MYKYPDIDDKNLFDNIIDKTWEDGGLEEKYISECIQRILEEERNLFLDAGCGTGRLMHTYLPFFKKIAAVDPDYDRLDKLKNNYFAAASSENHLPYSIEFVNATIQEYKTDKLFDCVLCSQIIQHVNTGDVGAILGKIRGLLKAKGCLMLLTTNWREGEGKFSKVNVLTNAHCVLTESEFNRCADSNNNFLPAQLFSEDELKTLLEDNGFRVIFVKKYHGFPEIKGDNFVFAEAV